MNLPNKKLPTKDKNNIDQRVVDIVYGVLSGGGRSIGGTGKSSTGCGGSSTVLLVVSSATNGGSSKGRATVSGSGSGGGDGVSVDGSDASGTGPGVTGSGVGIESSVESVEVEAGEVERKILLFFTANAVQLNGMSFGAGWSRRMVKPLVFLFIIR